MSNVDVYYVRSGEGGFLMEVPQTDGTVTYVKAEPGLSFNELPNGKFIAVRDTAEAQRQREMTSHERYFEQLQKNDKPADVRQGLKRQKLLEQRLGALAVERSEAPKVPGVRTIKDEQFADYMLKYAAETTRLGRAPRAHEWDFQPLVAYQEKLTKHKVRPIYKGEVGTDGTDILILEQGFGTGNQIQVPEQLERSK